MKNTFATATCAIALVASLTACAGSDNKSAAPTHTGGSTITSSATTSSAKATPTATAKATAAKPGPVALAAHATYTYGGLKAVVNLPADIPAASRPPMRVFSEFLQADARTTARSKLDPSLTNLASPNVVKDTKASITAKSVEGVGTVTYTISTVRSAGRSGYAAITGCVDQSKIVHLRKDGSHFVDPMAQKFPRVKVAADINRGETGLRVTSFRGVVGSC